MRRIDLHCHPGTDVWFAASVEPYAAKLTEYWKREFKPREEHELVADLERNGIEAVLVAHDTETVTGAAPCDNDYTVGLMHRHPEQYVGVWGSVDPWKGQAAIDAAVRAVRELGVLGFHFHPISGDFSVDNPRFHGLWETLSGLGVPVLIDVGFTGVGAGMSGGGGRRLKHAHPLAIDDLAASFPKLTIVAAHPAWPWTDEMMAVALHKGNVYWEMSGWGPEYFSPALKHDISRRLQDKIMFGSDYPSLTYERVLRGWDSLALSDAVLEKVFHGNAERVLGL